MTISLLDQERADRIVNAIGCELPEPAPEQALRGAAVAFRVAAGNVPELADVFTAASGRLERWADVAKARGE